MVLEDRYTIKCNTKDKREIQVILLKRSLKGENRGEVILRALQLLEEKENEK
ncbi:MAG: hypothetical protein ACRC0G_01400 [Fusobacteriaceae bacterium]